MPEPKKRNVKTPGTDGDKYAAPSPLSARVYAVIALVTGILAIALLLFYVYVVPNREQDRVFYLLLIPWSLASAVFLFGVMRSYARYSGRHVGHTLELGGPVVLFCLVMWGGFKLVPAAPPAFDLTVRAHSSDGAVALITSGAVTLELGNTLPSQSIGPDGEANFKNVPAQFRGASIRALAHVAGYKAAWQQQKMQGDVLDLALEKEPQPIARFVGTIVPPPENWSSLRVTVDGSLNETKVDQLGRFELPVTGREGDSVRVRIYAGREIVYDDRQTLPGPVTLKLHSSKRGS